METYNLEHNIKVFCVTAESFPDGVQAAHDALYKIVGNQGRTIYGLSKPDNNQIVYKTAVAESFEGEGEQHGCETFIIPKGKYAAETIHNWKNNMQKFGPTFMALLDNPKLDWNSWCIEWYKNDDEVLCMVKLQSA